MIKAKLSFFWTSNSKDHGSYGNKGTILILGSVNVPMSVISTKLYFVEISWVQKSYRYLSALCWKLWKKTGKAWNKNFESKLKTPFYHSIHLFAVHRSEWAYRKIRILSNDTKFMN